jgi:hypothetical protein
LRRYLNRTKLLLVEKILRLLLVEKILRLLLVEEMPVYL